MRFVRVALTGALLLAAATPGALSAQAAAGPRCKDGTRSPRTGFTACWFHGGLAEGAAAKAAAARPASADPAPASARRRDEGRHERVSSKSKSEGKTVCADGTRTSKRGRGACKHHGGVARERKAERAPSRGMFGIPIQTPANATVRPLKQHRAPKIPKGATARCMDGSFSHATHRKKACNRHGGVAGWLNPDIPPE